ncbi:MAG: hypothetical protein ACI4I2_06980 [Oscillospiraceae bacterium]
MDDFNENMTEDTAENAVTEKSSSEFPNIVQTNEKKYITLDETITLQAIICVVISILFVAANMFAPEVSEALSEKFKENYYMSSDQTEEVFETFLEFINSKPVSYD